MNKEDVVVRADDAFVMVFKMFKSLLEKVESTLYSGNIEATKYLIMLMRTALDNGLELMQYAKEMATIKKEV
jgi:hypothetical protein